MASKTPGSASWIRSRLADYRTIRPYAVSGNNLQQSEADRREQEELDRIAETQAAYKDYQRQQEQERQAQAAALGISEEAMQAQQDYQNLPASAKNDLMHLNSTDNAAADSRKGLLIGAISPLAGIRAYRQYQEQKQQKTDTEQQFKDSTGATDTQMNVWKALSQQENQQRQQEADAQRVKRDASGKVISGGKRTYDQEIQHANRMFDVKSGYQSDALKSEMTQYLDISREASLGKAAQSAEIASNIQGDGGSAAQKQADALRTQIRQKYGLSESDFDDLAYYGQELNDYAQRQKQQKDAYDAVHTGSTKKNIAGAIRNSAAALTVNPYAGMGAIGETVKYLSGGYRDKRSPLNPNSMAMAPSNIVSDYQGSTQQAIDDKNKALGILYGAGMSSIESAQTSTLGGAVSGEGAAARVGRSVLSLAPFGANAYASELGKNVTEGKTMGKAMAGALTNAGIEVATEVLSADKFWDMFKNHNATARKLLVDYLVSSGIEGSEEVVGDIAENFADAMINGGESEYNQSVREYMKGGYSEEEAKKKALQDTIADTAQSFAQGALSGAMGGAIATASGYANEVRGSRSFNEGFTQQDYRELADNISTEESDYLDRSSAQDAKQIRKIAEKAADGKKLSNGEQRRLYEAFSDLQNTEYEAEQGRQQEKQTAGKNQNQEESRTAPEEPEQSSIPAGSAIPAELRTERTSATAEEVHAKMAQATNAQELRTAVQEGMNSTDENAREQTLRNLENLTPMLEKRGITPEEISQAKITEEDIYRAGYSGQEMSLSSPREQQIYNRAKMDAGEARAAVNAGQRDQMAKNAETILNQTQKDFYRGGFQTGMNAASYDRVMKTVTNAARNGISIEEAIDKAGMDMEAAGGDQQKLRSDAAVMYSFAQNSVRNDAIREMKRAFSDQEGVRRFGDGIFTDARSDRTQDIPGAGTYKALAQITGLDIVLTDASGITGSNQGAYHSSDSTIYLNAGRAEQLAGTVFHEVGEFASVWSPKEFQSFTKAMNAAMQKSLGTDAYTKMRDAYVRTYAGEEGKTDLDLDKEMACDMVYQLLGSRDGMTKLMDEVDKAAGPKQAVTIRQKLADWIGKIADSIRDFFSEFRPTGYQKRVADAQIQNLDELQDMLTKSVATATKTYQQEKAKAAAETSAETGERNSREVKGSEAMTEDALTINGEKLTLSEDGKTATDAEGREYPLITADTFSTLDIKEQERTVRAILKEELGKMAGRKATIKSDNSTVWFGKDFAKEYTGSKDTLSLSKNRKLAKYNAYDNIIDLVENATNREWMENKEDKHQSDAARGWNYYDVDMLVKSGNGIFHYSGKLNVRLAADGKDYVYDITKIKRIAAQRIDTAKADVFADKEPSSKVNLAHKEGNSNRNSRAVEDASEEKRSDRQQVADRIAEVKEKKELSGDNIIEKTKTFVAIHNLTMDQLMSDIDLGGFPSPSIAIVRHMMQHNRYGEVSVIFNRDTIDPEVSKANRVYGGDAWTPTFPQIEYDVDEDKSYRAAHSIDDVAKGKIPDYLRDEARKFNSTSVANIAEKGGIDAVIERAKENYGMKAAYLASKGETVEDNVQKKEVGAYTQDKEMRFQKMEEAVSQIEDSFLEDRARLSAHDMLQKYGDVIQKAYDAYASTVPEGERGRWTNRVKRANEKAFFAHTVVDDIANAIDYYNNGNPTHTEYERNEDAVREQIDSRIDEAGYEAWLRDTYDGLTRGSGIYNGKDPYTASGDRKSFRQLHYSVTLENIVRAMNDAGAKGVGTFGGVNAVREEAIKNFRSVDEMHQSEGMLQKMDEEEYRKLESGYISEIGSIAKRIARKGDNSFIQNDDAANAILDAVRTRKTAAGIEKVLKSYGMNVYDGAGNDILNLMHRISEMPTEYFEAKPQRAVGLDEIAMVVAPDTITDEQKKALDDRRIPYQTYEAGNEDARHEVIESLQNVRFSRPVQDSEGRNLSEEQKEFFKDSKLKDEDGRLLVMYHGTPQGGFTVFQPDISYFTTSRDYAEEYARENSGNSRVSYTHDPEHMVYEVFLNAKKPFDTRDPKVRKVWQQGYFGKYSRTPLTDRGLLDWTDGYDIWDFIDDNDLDYDAVLLDEGSVPDGNGGNRWRGISYTVRDKNQIKNVDNKAPTEDADIRKSVNVGDELNRNEQAIEDDRQKEASILEKGAEALKGQQVNRGIVRQIATDLRREYGFAADIDQFSGDLEKLFAYMHSKNNINYDDFLAVMSDVTRPVIESGYTAAVSRQDYADFKNNVSQRSFSLTQEQRKAITDAFGSMKIFQKYYPEIHFSKDGESFLSQWEDLCKASGGILDPDIVEEDLPLELVDGMDALKPTTNFYGDNTQAAYNMALDIVERYLSRYSQGAVTGKVLNADKDRAVTSAVTKLKASQAVFQGKMEKEYKERLQQEREKLQARSDKAMERSADQIARLRAKNATTVQGIRERQKQKDQLRQINREAGRLYQYLTSPSDQNHIPAQAEEPIMELMAAIDFTQPNIWMDSRGVYNARILAGRTMDADGNYSYQWKDIEAPSRSEAVRLYKEALDAGMGGLDSRKWYDRMQSVKELYAKQKYGEDNASDESMKELLSGLDEELADQLNDVIRRGNGKVALAELNSSDLEVINKVLRNVLHAVNQINRSYTMPSQEVSSLAHDVMQHAQNVNGRKSHLKKVDSVINFFMLDNATPETYFHAIGADRVMDILIHAQNTKGARLREAQEYCRKVIPEGMSSEIEKWETEVHDFNGFQLTMAQAMSLYELTKRQDAMSHKEGGFKAGEQNGKTNPDSRTAFLTDREIQKIVDAIPPEAKKVADYLQEFMANNCAAWGNETSMKTFGYEKFRDKNYFPMQVDKNTVATRTSDTVGSLSNAIRNMGMAKPVTKNASNALILNDIFDVFSKHVSDMATYSSWTAPITDLIRFYNYKEKGSIGKDGMRFTEQDTVKDAISKVLGQGGQQYFTKLLASINQREQSSFIGGGIIETLTGAAKKAAVMGNARVVFQQPTAIFRAGKMIDYKYLAEGMIGKYAKQAAELQDRTSQVSWIKNQGNIDGYITQSVKSQITGVQSIGEKISDWTGWAAGKADEVAWRAMYRAVYAEQADLLGKDKIGTKEFEDAVNRRFDSLMLRTQVYDGTITRSQFMRSTDWMNKVQSAFMAEPVKTYNIVLRDAIDYIQSKKGSPERAEARKQIVKSAYVLFITNAVNAAAQSVWDAIRSAGSPDDEDKDFWERFLSSFGIDTDEDAKLEDRIYTALTGNLVSNMDMLNNIPIIADFWDITKKGFDKLVLGKSSYASSDDLTFSGINHLIDAASAIVKPGEKQTAYGAAAKIMRAVSDLTGIPIYALQRDAVAIYNVIAKDVTGGKLPVLQQRTKNTPQTQAKLDVYETIQSSTDLDTVKTAIEEAVEKGSGYDAISDGMKSAMADDLKTLSRTNPGAAARQINRLAEIKAYLSDKQGTRKKQTHAKKVEEYRKDIQKWIK